MKYTKRFTAAAMAGLIGAMTLVSGVTAYAATGWQQNGSTYYYYDANGELHKGWLNTENSYYYLNLSTQDDRWLGEDQQQVVLLPGQWRDGDRMGER